MPASDINVSDFTRIKELVTKINIFRKEATGKLKYSYALDKNYKLLFHSHVYFNFSISRFY